MNTKVVKIFFAVGLLVMLMGVGANGQSLKLKANIPFDFTYGDVVMPAGEYDLMKLNMLSAGVFQIRDEAGKNTAVRNVMTQIARNNIPTESVLIFNRYRGSGGEVSYFLSQVWVAGSDRGFEFFKHRSERELMKRMATRDIITIVVKRVNPATE
ncbi:MAG: hypothetical protein JNK38_01995 [Acidobacteria bacterium]|nr:hypothetical protein [Acidobacteriota bacterium]